MSTLSAQEMQVHQAIINSFMEVQRQNRSNGGHSVHCPIDLTESKVAESDGAGGNFSGGCDAQNIKNMADDASKNKAKCDIDNLILALESGASLTSQQQALNQFFLNAFKSVQDNKE